MAPATTTSVQVALRIRPITPQDAVSIPSRFQRTVIHATSETSVVVDAVTAAPGGSNAASPIAAPATVAANKKQSFAFDQVHDPETDQYKMYTSTAEPLISRFLEGFNCTILAYGQTSSGKTHTMTGVDLDGDPSDPSNGMGIIPRSIAEIFAHINETKKEKRGAWNSTVKGSFIEIYNEDLIDLLSSDEPNARREVQIREDKDGHIIWGGLREVPVRNVAEVMALIRQGTSIRRTNETQMNAQSSRSHAIFSLTLIQKRYNGSGPPPRSSSPLPPQPSPSRLARPGSVMNPSPARVGSPTFGRPPTPSFHSAMGRAGSQASRPHSSLGHSEPDRLSAVAASSGDWTTITSKFHFVDLAGSERLKRTAAIGERIKEGISINSGLLALGNVISALGDPSKTRTTTHVPYRDSKLTRLLQDSLGGNSHTLMIACVSPVEWNVGETVNTLKYANRARNIRNRVRIDEREEGWDDIDWLQATVVRLRKELKTLREGGMTGELLDRDSLEPISVSGAGRQVRDQLAELQSRYVELREKYTERTEELTRLRREAGENIRRSGGSIAAGTGRYEEIVGPVIEEYEKTISTMEAELALNRAALRHTNDLLTEKEEELAVEAERHSVTEAYVEELRARVAKLMERETSTEAYIQDLEEKIKGFSSSSVTASESMGTVQKELAKYKELEATNTAYIAQLEGRLGKSEESVLDLRAAVEYAETVSQKQTLEIKSLEQVLTHMRGDEKGWRTDLEQREAAVRELETKLKEWELKKDDAASQRERLGDLVSGIEAAKRSMDDVSGGSSRAEEPAYERDGTDIQLYSRLKELQETHTATLADLSHVSEKYRDALREISDLAAQLEELKLNATHSSNNSVSDAGELNLANPATRRRKPSVTRTGSRDSSMGEIATSIVNGTGRRTFFRQATSTESLRTRSQSQSLSLSQELSSARSPHRSTPPHLHHQRSESLLTNGSARYNLSPSMSLPNGITHGDRTVPSLEQEIMRLQEVLRERESEIKQLERALNGREIDLAPNLDVGEELSPQTMDHFSALRTTLIQELPDDEADSMSTEKRASLGRLNELMRSMAQKESQHREIVEDLSAQLKQVRRQYDDLTALSRDQTHNMSNELEALRKLHLNASSELDALRARHSELTKSIEVASTKHAEDLRLLTEQHASELAAWGLQMTELKAIHDGAQTSLINSHSLELSKIQQILDSAKQDHAATLQQIQEDHELELMTIRETADKQLSQLKAQHSLEVSKLKEALHAELEREKQEGADALSRNDEEYYVALSKLRAQHEEEIQRRSEQSASELQRVQQDAEARLRQADMASEGAVAESAAVRDEIIGRLQTDHQSLLERKKAEYANDLAQRNADHTRLLKEKDAEKSQLVAKLRSEHASAIAQLNERLAREVATLNGMLATRQQEYEEEIRSMRDDFSQTLKASQIKYEKTIAEIKARHDSTVEELQSEGVAKIETVVNDRDAQIAALITRQEEGMEKMRLENRDIAAKMELMISTKEEAHRAALSELHSQQQRTIDELSKNYEEATSRQSKELSDERKVWQKDRELLLQDVDLLKATLEQSQSQYSSLQKAYDAEAEGHLNALQTAKKDIHSLKQELDMSRTQLLGLQEQQVQSHSEHQKDLETHRSTLEELEKVRSAMSNALAELEDARQQVVALTVDKSKQENMVRDLQAQLLSAASKSAIHDHSNRPVIERTISYPRSNGLPPPKLPPLSPPPSIPPPPLPTALPSIPSEVSHASLTSSSSTHGRHSSGSQETHETSPTPTTSVNGHSDDFLLAKLQSQAKLMEEQEAMIKTLNKQLSHCEGDLQAHVDLVSTLEASLNDSERNLRKARNQANELTRERDTLTKQLDNSRNEVRESQRELASARQSVLEQKQSLEHRLDEERKAKERTRAQLDARMEELQRRKSKFACM